MIEFSAFTKRLLRHHLNEIINEIKGFEFTAWQEEDFLREMPDKWKFSIAAFADSKLAGFSINSRKVNIFYIHLFYIFKDYRNTGLGNSLLDICMNTSLENNMRIMQLICHKKNTSALEFYYKNKFYIKDTSVKDSNLYLMEKIL